MSRLPSDYERDAVEFGRKVRELREAHGWSQYELAAKVVPPISRQQINLIEHGQSGGRDESGGLLANPRLATLLALCRALDVRIVIDANRPSGFVLDVQALSEHDAGG